MYLYVSCSCVFLFKSIKKCKCPPSNCCLWSKIDKEKYSAFIDHANFEAARNEI